MPLTIKGWTINNAPALEIRETLAEHQGVDVADVDADYIRTWMQNHVDQLVADRRRRTVLAAASVDSTSVFA